MRTCRTRPEVLTAFAVLALGIFHDTVDQLQNVVFTVDIAERIVSHCLLKVDGIEYFYLISTHLEHFTTFFHNCTFRVCDNIAGVHLHEVWLNVKASFAGAGTADYQHVLIDIILGIFIAAHHDALGLRQENVLVKLGVNEGLNIFRCPP